VRGVDTNLNPLNSQRIEETYQADALDHFTGAFVLECVLSEEIDDALAEIDQFLHVFVCFQFHEWNDHRAHQVADFQRAFAAHQNGCAFVFTGSQSTRHDIDAVHAAHAFVVIDFYRMGVIDSNAGDARTAPEIFDLLELEGIGRTARNMSFTNWSMLCLATISSPAPRRCGCCRATSRSRPCQNVVSSSCNRSDSRRI